ncbi:MAG: hypothetical protein HQL76_16245 [Magnetococcales bacterium]|nr:hypothetical protein [Magnetococcales bacterium]
MIETMRSMEKLRELLLEVPFRHPEALGVVKEMMLHGVNDREVFYFQQAAVLLLEHALRPALQGNVELESNLKRLITRIQRNPGIDPNEVTQTVSRILAESTPFPPGNSQSPQESHQEAKHLFQLLQQLPGFSAVMVSNHSQPPGWRQIDEAVDSFIMELDRQKRRREREWQRQRQPLLRLTETLIQTAERIHHPVDGLKKLMELLDGPEELPVKLPPFIENLLFEARELRKAMEAAQNNIHKAEHAISELNGLFRKADLQLLHSRDQELIDIFTGLGNRFALTEHRKRLSSQDHQGILFLHLDADPEARPALSRSEICRILGFLGRRIHKLEIGLPFHIGEETIAILLSQTLVDVPVAGIIKERILDRLQGTKGFPVHIRFGLATLRLAMAEDEALILDKGKHLARISAHKGGQPLFLKLGKEENK